MRCEALSFLAVSFAVTVPAFSQVNWETRVRYLVNGSPTTSVMLTESDSPSVDITVQAGIFNVTGLGAGQANHGLSMWSGRIESTIPGLSVDPATSRVPVYNFGPATVFGGFVTGSGTRIEGTDSPGSEVYSARAIAPTEPVVWNSPDPIPTSPPEYGVESYVSVFRYRYTFPNGVFAQTVLSTTGQGGPIIQWQALTVTPPEGGTPGEVSFIGISPSQILLNYSAPTLTITRLPAPASGLLAALAGLAIARRRR
ncbi:MAG: hypothetical protein KF745_09325 [Phycisphaeraceae bacterium]|nr:hypothetical protein [Phycisphaeraceae bacterium]